MQHEGRPPYSIRFGPSFFDSLEEIAAEEGDPEPDMARWVERLSKPRSYVMSPRAFALARAGVMRARSFGVLPADAAGELEVQLDFWAADLRGGHERTGDRDR